MLAADAPALPASSLFAGGGLLSGRRSNLEEPHRGGGGGWAGAGGRAAAAAAGRRAGIFSSASSASSVSSAPPQSPQRLVSLLQRLLSDSSVPRQSPQRLLSLLSAAPTRAAASRPALSACLPQPRAPAPYGRLRITGPPAVTATGLSRCSAAALPRRERAPLRAHRATGRRARTCHGDARSGGGASSGYFESALVGQYYVWPGGLLKPKA